MNEQCHLTITQVIELTLPTQLVGSELCTSKEIEE